MNSSQTSGCFENQDLEKILEATKEIGQFAATKASTIAEAIVNMVQALDFETYSKLEERNGYVFVPFRERLLAGSLTRFWGSKGKSKGEFIGLSSSRILKELELSYLSPPVALEIMHLVKERNPTLKYEESELHSEGAGFGFYRDDYLISETGDTVYNLRYNVNREDQKIILESCTLYKKRQPS